MPVFEQGYRRYAGKLSDGSRALAIAWENVRPRMRWWVWVLMLVLNCMFAKNLLYAILIFMATLGASLFNQVSKVVPPPTVVFDDTHRGDATGMVMGLLQNQPLGLAWEILHGATFATAVFASVVCAGLLSSDRRTGALQIYFARPVTRLDYLGGKLIAAFCFVSLTTLLPAYFLWIESVAFGASADFTWKTWIAPLVILGAGACYALWSMALVLALSAVMKRPVVVAIAALFLFLLLEALGAILGKAIGDPWRVIQPDIALGIVTAPICGLGVPAWANLFAAYGIGVALPVLLLAFVWWRVRAVEVVT